ncbi:MAG TPA: hypothetical protein VFN89_11140 [Solirubrobacterales bacterium]|nr:hypothetical protein [Solirubrobacterales bacterium]
MSDAAAEALPSLAEARAWVGLELDDVDGRRVGRVEGLYTDPETDRPVWLAVAVDAQRRGRFGFRRRGAKAVAVPLRECAAMPGRAWAAQGVEAMRAAPAVDLTRPLLREHEAAICAHYGIGAAVGRHAEIATRPEGAITAQPA